MFKGKQSFAKKFSTSAILLLVSVMLLQGMAAGADLFWSLGTKDRIQAQLLFSRSLTPDRPDLSPQWTGERLSDFALSVEWQHDTKTWWWRSLYQDVGKDFRADLGFMPQVGYRRFRQNLGYNFYSDGFFTTITPQFAGGDTWDRRGRTVEGFFYPGVEVEGKGNMNAGLYYNYDVNRAGEGLLHRNQIFGFLNLSPSRVLSRVELNGFFGDMPDYTNNRTGHGGDLALYVAARPLAHLDLQFSGEHQWVNSSRGGHYGRLYAADVARLKAVYTFTARAYLRAIVQWAGAQRDPALYPYAVSSRSGDLNGSVLYAYRVNWQTLFYVGYGDDRTLDAQARMVRTGRQVFFKVSYAFQR